MNISIIRWEIIIDKMKTQKKKIMIERFER